MPSAPEATIRNSILAVLIRFLLYAGRSEPQSGDSLSLMQN
jgi:hypothetical protein